MLSRLGRLLWKGERGNCTGRMSSWTVVVLFLALLLLPSSNGRPSDLSHSRLLQMLVDQSPGLADRITDRQRIEAPSNDEQNMNRELAEYLSPEMSQKRNSAKWRSLLQRGPSRRGRLSIGMTLDALSDILSAERRRQYQTYALKAQRELHRIGKRDTAPTEN